MFCTKCGNFVPDGQAFCTACGSRIEAVPDAQTAAPVEPVYSQETVVLSDYQYQVPAQEENSFVNSVAGNKTFLLKLLAIGCALLLLLSYVVTVNTSFEKIPLISTIFTIAGEEGEINEMFDEFDEYADRLDRYYEMAEEQLADELSKGEMKKLKKFVDISNKCAKKMSLANFTKLLSSYEDLDKIGMDDIADYIVDSVEEAKEIKLVLNVVKGFLLFCALVCAVFVFFGGFKVKPGLAIFGTVLSVMFCLSYCHFLMLLLNLAAQIVMIRLAKKVKMETAQMQYYPA